MKRALNPPGSALRGFQDSKNEHPVEDDPDLGFRTLISSHALRTAQPPFLSSAGRVFACPSLSLEGEGTGEGEPLPGNLQDSSRLKQPSSLSPIRSTMVFDSSDSGEGISPRCRSSIRRSRFAGCSRPPECGSIFQRHPSAFPHAGTCNMVQNDPAIDTSGVKLWYRRPWPLCSWSSGNIHNQENGGTQKAGQGCGSALPHRVQTSNRPMFPSMTATSAPRQARSKDWRRFASGMRKRSRFLQLLPAASVSQEGSI